MSNFRADCSRCCGLCCIVPAQLAAQGFPSDKPAHARCRHLGPRNRCSIYEKRDEHGYAACKAFDCFGAGQWITQTLFANARWTDSPDIAERMSAAYRSWLPRFEAAALLEAALPYVREDAKALFAARISALMDAHTIEPVDAARLRREILALIRSVL